MEVISKNRKRFPWGKSFLLVAAVYLGATFALGCYTFIYAKGASYLSNDPRACVNCHIMREHYAGWQKSSHHAVASCNDCHIPHQFLSKWLVKAENGFWHSKGFTMQNFHEPIRIRPKNRKVLQANCLGCHGAIVNEISAHPGDPRRMLDCMHCHRSVGHGPTP
ncbi:MAG TPA: cytochrome c nitrite reductase small subunit [Fibrobacteria bacterium]|nr:cytochrome c nitrite reductase small subunit [Fibrobacteria bacterium]